MRLRVTAVRLQLFVDRYFTKHTPARLEAPGNVLVGGMTSFLVTNMFNPRVCNMLGRGDETTLILYRITPPFLVTVEPFMSDFPER